MEIQQLLFAHQMARPPLREEKSMQPLLLIFTKKTLSTPSFGFPVTPLPPGYRRLGRSPINQTMMKSADQTTTSQLLVTDTVSNFHGIHEPDAARRHICARIAARFRKKPPARSRPKWPTEIHLSGMPTRRRVEQGYLAGFSEPEIDHTRPFPPKSWKPTARGSRPGAMTVVDCLRTKGAQSE